MMRARVPTQLLGTRRQEKGLPHHTNQAAQVDSASYRGRCWQMPALRGTGGKHGAQDRLALDCELHGSSSQGQQQRSSF